MINYTPTPDFYNDYIAHYNHFHDPKNGQFTSKNGLTRKQRFGVSAANAGVSAIFGAQGVKSIKEGDKALGTAQLAVSGLAAANSAANLIKGIKTPKSKKTNEFDNLKKKPVNEMTDNEFNKFLKGIDDKEVRELARNERNKNKSKDKLSSSSYNKDFLKYIKPEVVKPEMVDDEDLMDLLIMEYEDQTGKKAMKR